MGLNGKRPFYTAFRLPNGERAFRKDSITSITPTLLAIEVFVIKYS